jgi:hypothetical protein
MNSQTKQGLVWGGLLILLGTVSLLETFTDLGAWAWVATLVLGGVGVYGIYAIDRTEKWMLVISYVLFAVASLVVLLTLNVLPDPIIPTFVLLAIALPFFVAFINSGRSSWGLLIPVYILVAISIMVPLITTGVLSGILIAAYVLFAIAIPFFVVYARDSKKWWALIPGGITAVIGLSFLIAEDAAQYIAPAVLIIAGAWVVVRAITGKRSE